jgi:hypothetical protein
MKFLIFLALTSPALGQVAISLQSADQAAIPGSTRSVYASVQGTPDLTVKWKVTGGCTLASPITASAPQVVSAPATGSACTITTQSPTNEEPSFKSATSCTVTAASAAEETKTASIVIPVCAQSVILSTFPASTVLYKDQYAVIQSNLRGSVDTGVSWAITTNPHGAGLLTGGTSNRHAVFSAKAPGTYVLTATSAADHRKTASSTIYVTAQEFPAPVADHTEAVDCTAVGSGKTYEVGPAREFHDLNAISWTLLKPGDTVRIHNDDLTGAAPTTYHQHLSMSVGGTPAEPIRICGVPDAKGVKPIIDAENSTTRPDENWAGGYVEDHGAIVLYDGAHKGDAAFDGNRNIVIEGLHIRNVKFGTNFVVQGTSNSKAYSKFNACIWVQTGSSILIRGNDLDNCSQGVFTNGNTPQGGMVYDLTVEGNYIHNWGDATSEGVHGLYLQAIGVQAQFNYFGNATAGAKGNVLKLRSVLNFLRWNYISQPVTVARAFDMVEPQSFSCYVIPFQFAFTYHGRGRKADCGSPNKGADVDPFTADEVAANYEAYHSDYIYGNMMDDAGSNVPFVHYGYDQQVTNGPSTDRRGGTLYYWNNSHLIRKAGIQKTAFEAATPDTGHTYEFPSIQSVNNIFYAAEGSQIQWTWAYWTQITVDSNWITPGYRLPYRNYADSYQGAASVAEFATCDRYGSCKPSNGHMIWERNGKRATPAESVFLGAAPFNGETFRPASKIHGLAAALPKEIHDQPSNMEYFPATNTIAPKQDQTFLGALD